MHPFSQYEPQDIVHITMPTPPTGPVPPWVRVHVRPDLDPDLDYDMVDGIPCTTVERTIVDLAEEYDVEEVLSVIDIAARRGQLDVARLENTIERKQHDRATRVATEALQAWRDGRTVPVAAHP